MIDGRDDKDFAIEFGRYLAQTADRYLKAVDAWGVCDVGWPRRTLESAIYEFRKRVAKVQNVARGECLMSDPTAKAELTRDARRLDWLEDQAKRSPTGISFDWIPLCEGERSGFRFMRRHFIGGAKKTLRSAIDAVMAR